MTLAEDYQIYIGSSTGAFKGVCLRKEDKCTIKNIQNVRFLTNKASVLDLNWGNTEESEIIVAYSGQKIKIYDTDFKNFNTNTDVSFGEGEIVGVSRYDECILTAVQSGHVKLWRYKTEEDQWTDFNVGGSLECMKHNKDSNVMATGGKENDLKLWDLNTTKNIFSAKNVKPDEFDLRRPVWVNDIAFIPNSERVAVCSKQGYVRIYDPKVTTQRRPVIKIDLPNTAFSCISTTSQSHYVLVGSTTGDMMAIDLRGKGKPCYKYKGFAGCVKDIACPASGPNLILSVSLDRHFRVHDFHSKKLLRKDYMQSRLTSILVRSDFTLESPPKKDDIEEALYGESDEKYDPEHHEMNSAPIKVVKDVEEANEDYDDGSDLEILEEIDNGGGEEKGGREDEEEGEEEENRDEDMGDSKDHKKSLKKLKNMDPEFYKYLEENDRELLNFDASSDEDDDDKDADTHVPPDELEGHSDESDFEEDATGGDYVEDGTVRKVTLAMVSKWRADLTSKSKPLQTIAIVTKAFHAALFRILEEEDDQPAKFKVEGGGIFNAVVQLCVVELKPAILRLLKLPADSNKINVENNKMWPRVKALLKHYLVDLIKLLGAVSSPDIVSVLLKHLHGMLMFLSVLSFNFKPLLRQLVALWSQSDDETVRIIAFLNILRLTVNNKRKHLENVLKYMYTAYIGNSKFVSPSSLPNINFMRNSLSEMFSLDESVAYTHTFLYIRQLAIHLRNAVTLHTKQAYQTVYNWQYIAALRLWTSLLTGSHANDKKQLSTLLYPLIQIIIGVIKLIPTSTYFPLRFHCIDLLNQISNETGLFIPTAPLILEAFQVYDLNKKHSKVSMKPLDFTCILRLNKIHLVENGFKTSVVDLVYQHLLTYMQGESARVSFPDLCIPVVLQLRAFVKSSKQPTYSRKMKQLLDKIEETARVVEEERRKAALPLSNRDGIRVWERGLKAKGTPLMSFYATWKKMNDQREAKKFTDNENMADFKLPTLKRSLPKDKKARNKEDGPVDLFPSDDEDDGIGFGDDSEDDEELEDLNEEEDLFSDEENEEKEPEKKKRKRDKNKNRKKKGKKAKKNSEGENGVRENGEGENGVEENGVIGENVKDTVVDFKVSTFK